MQAGAATPASTPHRPWEFISARDYNGHGTHTSSTAGGNNGVTATGPAAVFGTISGMAPHARIAMYKALWSTEDAARPAAPPPTWWRPLTRPWPTAWM